MMIDYIKLSKEISYALRHRPDEYGLELDNEGWVEIQDLIDGLKRKSKWSGINMSDIMNIVNNEDKKRFEVKGNLIRACYGHSVQKRVYKEEIVPPALLYHGTARENISSILKEGLQPMKRQYVHLSEDEETAKNVGSRHSNNIIILKIDAKRAYNDGVKFYYGNDTTWLADGISSKYITE